jgi:DNA-binding LacI/PurR family transcriptional regulator
MNNYKEFFERNGDKSIKASYYDVDDRFTVEKLYQVFAARYTAEHTPVVEPDYAAIAKKAGYHLAVNGAGQYFWFNGAKSDNTPYLSFYECWKAACEDNGLLGQ